MPEIVGTFLRTELRDEGADGAVKAWDGSRCYFTQDRQFGDGESSWGYGAAHYILVSADEIIE